MVAGNTSVNVPVETKETEAIMLLFMIISQVKIIAFQTITNRSIWTFYIGGKPAVYIINRKIHWVLGNTRFISSVEHDISHIMFNTRNKSGISAHPCIILSIINRYTVFCTVY